MFPLALLFSAALLAPAHAAPEAAWETTHSVLSWGPPGAELQRRDWERRLRVPTEDGERFFAMSNATGDDHPCTQATSFGEDLFTIDVDEDGEDELFIVWTFATGAGHDGAIDRTELCGWKWTHEGPVYLTALLGELGSLRLHDPASIQAHLSTQRTADDRWVQLDVEELSTSDEKTGRYRLGSQAVSLRQTGHYHVHLTVDDAPDRELLMMTSLSHMFLPGATRVHDFTDSWEPVEGTDGPICCGFDMSQERSDRPRVTAAWSHNAMTYAVVRQEQTTVSRECVVVRWSAQGAGQLGQSCADFEQERLADSTP